MKTILLCIVLSSILFAAPCLLIEEYPFIEMIFNDRDIVNKGANYSTEYLRKISNHTGASNYPKLDDFNDENIRQQIRKNVLVIINKFLTLSHDDMTWWQKERVDNALALQEIYQSDDLFLKRPLPKYYHTSNNKWVKAILTDMKIKSLPAVYPGAWVATGFYDWTAIRYVPVFSFSSALELPLGEVSTESHYIRDAEYDNYYGLGRLNDIDLWKNKTDLISWAADPDVVNFIKANFTVEKATFLLERLTTVEQIVLERQFIMIAQVYSKDRANAMLTGSVWPNFPRSKNTTCTFGQGSNEYLVLNLYDLKTEHRKASPLNILPVDKYLPNLDINDMKEFAQLIADGNLLDQPPASYDELKHSVQRMLKRVPVVQ